MTWTATLLSYDIQPNGCTLSIVYSDGVSQKFRKDYSLPVLSDAIIQQTVANEIANMGNATASASAVSLAIGSQITQPAVVPVVPTPAQMAQTQFLSDWRALGELLRASSAGVISASDPRIAALQKTIQGEWLDSYLFLI